MEPPRWNILTPSQYEWERRALDFIRAGLPNHDPYRAWTNFEFQSHDGAIYEVDLLVLTKQGFWLVEIKSWPGQLRGKIDGKVAKALARAVEQAGIRPSQRSRRVGDYILGELLADGPGYQDRLGKHASFEDVYCRVR